MHSIEWQHEVQIGVLWCADKRRGQCYLKVPEYSRRGACTMELGRDTSKADCCCTLGRGWGETAGVCEACPRNGTSMHAALASVISIIHAQYSEINDCSDIMINVRYGVICMNRSIIMTTKSYSLGFSQFYNVSVLPVLMTRWYPISLPVFYHSVSWFGILTTCIIMHLSSLQESMKNCVLGDQASAPTQRPSFWKVWTRSKLQALQCDTTDVITLYIKLQVWKI